MEVVGMSMIMTRHEVVEHTRRSRLRAHLAQLDYLRGLAEATALGVTQSEIARELRLTQPTISSSLKTARVTPQVREGFHGASPYEIAERYAAGEITRDQLVDELTRWSYAPSASGDGVDWLTYEAGEWNEQVVPALDEGLIDDATYTEIQDRRDELAR
jgi:transcriptional regulator with XRE-family HTH domain